MSLALAHVFLDLQRTSKEALEMQEKEVEKRVSMYGGAYTWAEFAEHYGDDAQWYWDQAKLGFDRLGFDAAATQSGEKPPPAMSNHHKNANPYDPHYRKLGNNELPATESRKPDKFLPARTACTVCFVGDCNHHQNHDDTLQDYDDTWRHGYMYSSSDDDFLAERDSQPSQCLECPETVSSRATDNHAPTDQMRELAEQMRQEILTNNEQRELEYVNKCGQTLPDNCRIIGSQMLRGSLVHMTLKAGTSIPHEHHNHLMYVLKGGKLQIAGYRSGHAMVPDGAAFAVPAGVHMVRNIGDTDVEVLFFDEFEEGKEYERDAILAADPRNYEILCEDDSWTVGEMKLKPGDEDELQADRDQLVYILEADQLTIHSGKDDWMMVETFLNPNDDDDDDVLLANQEDQFVYILGTDELMNQSNKDSVPEPIVVDVTRGEVLCVPVGYKIMRTLAPRMHAASFGSGRSNIHFTHVDSDCRQNVKSQ